MKLKGYFNSQIFHLSYDGPLENAKAALLNAPKKRKVLFKPQGTIRVCIKGDRLKVYLLTLDRGPIFGPCFFAALSAENSQKTHLIGLFQNTYFEIFTLIWLQIGFVVGSLNFIASGELRRFGLNLFFSYLLEIPFLILVALIPKFTWFPRQGKADEVIAFFQSCGFTITDEENGQTT